MEKQIISIEAATVLKLYLKEQVKIDTKAFEKEVQFINEDNWIKDAAVIETIICAQGNWQVSLIFALHSNPLQLIVRNIKSCISEQKATRSIDFMKKEIAINSAPTLPISIDLLKLCTN